MRRFWLALLLGAACAPSGSAPGPTPAPPYQPSPGPQPEATPSSPGLKLRTTGRYRYALSQRDSVVAQMPSGEAQEQVSGRTAYLTISLQPTGTGALFEAVVDSIHADPDVTLPGIEVDGARGARFTGTLSGTGWLEGLTGARRSNLLDQIRDQLNLMFPVLPPDGVHPGSAWTGTAAAVPARLSVVDLNEAVDAKGSAQGEELIAGERVLPVTVVRTTAGKGTGNQVGQDLDLETTGLDSLTYRLATDGRVVSADGTSTKNFTISVRAVGQTVPVAQLRRVMFTLLK